MFSIKQLISIASKFPGFDLKQILLSFATNLSNEVNKQQQTLGVSNPDNKIMLMAFTDGATNELIFVPVEVTRPTETENSKVVKSYEPINLHQKIAQTDINKAVDMLSEENQKLSFFEVLEACKQ